MKKIIAGLFLAVLLVGCAMKGASEVQAEKSQVQTEKAEQNDEEFEENFEIQAEGIDYLSVEGIQIPEGSVLAVIGKDSKSEFWKQVKAGAAQAVADINESLGFSGDAKVELLYDAPENEAVAEQIEIIDQVMDKNPDALCIGFVDVNSGRTQLDLAQANGIPVLAVDSGLENSQITVTVQTDNYQAGAQAAKEVCKGMGDSGKIALLVHSSQTESGIEREKGFAEEIERNHPGVEIVNIAYRQQDERSVDEIVASVLLEHPDLKAYFGTNDAVTKELLKSMELYGGEESQVLVAGFDASSKAIEAVEQEKMAGIMAQNPYGMGYAAAVAAFREMAGLENAKEVYVEHFWIT